jgi:hypothetical protein
VFFLSVVCLVLIAASCMFSACFWFRLLWSLVCVALPIFKLSEQETNLVFNKQSFLTYTSCVLRNIEYGTAIYTNHHTIKC